MRAPLPCFSSRPTPVPSRRSLTSALRSLALPARPQRRAGGADRLAPGLPRAPRRPCAAWPARPLRPAGRCRPVQPGPGVRCTSEGWRGGDGGSGGGDNNGAASGSQRRRPATADTSSAPDRRPSLSPLASLPFFIRPSTTSRRRVPLAALLVASSDCQGSRRPRGPDRAGCVFRGCLVATIFPSLAPADRCPPDRFALLSAKSTDQRLFLVGGVTVGSSVKMVNQLCAGVHVAALAEGMASRCALSPFSPRARRRRGSD